MSNESMNEMSPENQEYIREAMLDSLELVGIGPEYRNTMFSKYEDAGLEAKEVFLAQWEHTVYEGNGVTIVGGEVAGHLHTLMARAAHMAGMSVQVIGLARLSSVLVSCREDEWYDPLDGVRAVFIQGFQEDRECPLSPYNVTLVEEFIGWHLGRKGAVFPWIRGEPNRPWWSDSLNQRLGSRNVWHEVVAS